jgi:hypothetical protein
MSFSQRRFAPSLPRTGGPGGRGGAPVHGVGQRVLVACSADGVALTDDAGRSVVGTLADGDEVEIIAWRPRGARGTLYRVRSTGGGGTEGWINADGLRVRPQPAPAPVAAAPRAPTASEIAAKAIAAGPPRRRGRPAS